MQVGQLSDAGKSMDNGRLVLVNCIGSLSRNCVDRLTDRAQNDLNSVEES